MKKLVQGIIDFRQSLTPEKRELFAKLALGQKPDTLFIACSDSRVVPNLFASTNPGDLFVLRNIGNLIPPASGTHLDCSASAVLEFAVFSLGVSDIIICGHSECGAMQALAAGCENLCCSHLKSWLQHGKEALRKVREGSHAFSSHLSEHNQISQMNVLQQIEHLKTYPFIQERLEKGEIRIHGWWFDIGQADVYCYESSLQRYVLIDEEEGQLLMSQMDSSIINCNHDT